MGKKYPISYTKLLSSGEKCEKLWSRSKSSSKFGLGGHSEVMIPSFISVAESLHHKFFSSMRYLQEIYILEGGGVFGYLSAYVAKLP